MPSEEKQPARDTIPASHRAEAKALLRCVVVTVSDTRTLEDDRGGELLAKYLSDAGHEIVARLIVPDEPEALRTVVATHANGPLQETVDAILMTGGTGITARDQTYETISELLTKPLPGYGEIFRMLSYEEIGPAAMLSRAIGGVVGTTLLLTMPGSPAAVRLAMEKLIVPELPHLVREATK